MPGYTRCVQLEQKKKKTEPLWHGSRNPKESKYKWPQVTCHRTKQNKMIFFFLDRWQKNFIKKKIANLSTLGMYNGGKNQEPKLQWSSKAGREKQEQSNKATLQISRICKKEDLISSKEHSHPSKHLAFLSLQIHHIKQWGTSLQKIILRCCPNLPCQDSNTSSTLSGIT